jgi:hypothetical protein
MAGIWNAPGQLPNNLLTPSGRVNNGQFDPTTGQPTDLSSNRQRAPAADQVAQGGQFNVPDQGQQPAGAFNAATAAGLKDASPEVQAQATQAATAIQQNPLAREALQKPEVAAQVTEEAKPKFDQQAQEEYAAAVPQPTNGNPQDYGKWMADMGTHIEKSWGAMGPMGRLAFGLGVPMALIGMMSGNIGGFLMGALGLGAAGMAGASGGMFGPDAQNFGQSAMSSIGAMMGAPDPADIKQRISAASDLPPEQAKAEMTKILAEVEPWAGFHSDAQKLVDVAKNNALPNRQMLETNVTNAALQGPEQANAALSDARKQVAPWAELDPHSSAQQFMTESGDKNYLYNKAEQYANDNYAKIFDERVKNPTNWEERAANILGLTGEAANTPGTWSHYLSNLSSSKEDRIARDLAAKGYKKAQAISIMQKAAKCWAGYERVPGTKAYTNGSCRPAGSKKTKKEVTKGKKQTEKKAAKPYTGQHSSKPFDATHAAGLMGMKPGTDAQQVYNRMMHKYQSGGFTPAQFSEFRTKYDGLPPAFAPASPQPSQAQAAQAKPQTPATSVKPPVPPAPVSSQPKPPAPATSMPRPTMIQAPKTQPQAEPPKTPKIVSRVTQPALAPESPGQQAYYSAVSQAAR